MTVKNLPDLNHIKKVYVIGICGTLMGAFAAYLKRRGIEVTGSDQNVYPPMSDVLRNAGIELFGGYKAGNLLNQSKPPDLVVIGNVIRADNPEAKVAMRGDYAYTSLPEAMELLMLKQTRNLVVAGTHGKTTSSSMLAHVLSKGGKDPSYFIGGVPHDIPYSFHVEDVRKGGLFVLEGDEYDTAFWDKVPKFNHYLPDDVILTSIEYDHADIYPDFASVVRAFDGLIARVRPGGRIIGCFDYKTVSDVCLRAHVPVLSYGSSDTLGARFTPGKIRMDGEFTRFEILDSGKALDGISLSVPGKHNVLNALGVWVECRELGLEASAIRSALRSFRGVKRRQEVAAEIGGILVIDDFAHHPTAVKETLQALKLRYPNRRLIAVFEPRSATSRRKIFQKDYAEVFGEAQAVFISAPYDQSRIPEGEQFSSEELVEDLKSRGVKADLMDTPEEGLAQVAGFSRSGDIIAVLSNGGFGGFIPKLIAALETRTE